MLVGLKRLFAKKELPEPKPEPVSDFIEPYNEEDIIQMGRDAEELLQNQSFKIAINKYRNKLISAWRNSTPLQTHERESVWHRLEAMEDVVLTLKGMIKNMIAEKKKIEEEKTKGAKNE